MLERTFRIYAAAALGLAFACACQAGGAPDIGLVVRFDSPPSRYFLKNMKDELARVLPVFHLEWVGPGQSNRQSYRRLVFVTFHGVCTALPGKPVAAVVRRVRLGETRVTDGAILPFSEIDCDRLRDFLDTADFNDAGHESRMGRASGRVLAHELYHVLLETSAHGQKGIAKAVHSPAALLSRSLRFEEGELELLSSRYR